MFKIKIFLFSVKWGDWYFRSFGLNIIKRLFYFNFFYIRKVFIVYFIVFFNIKEDKYIVICKY